VEKFQLDSIIGLYLPLSIGVIAQVVFLLLPVQLKNWRDDALNALTYISVQLFVACCLFVVFPRAAELFHLNDLQSFFVVCIVLVVSWFRVIQLIPLEGTSATVQVLPPPAQVGFTEFYDKVRLLSLASLSEYDPDDVRRIVLVKERIRKRDNDGRGRAMALGPRKD
jgi:hypothetical protein